MEKRNNWSKKTEDATKETNHSKETGHNNAVKKERETLRNGVKKEKEVKPPVKGKVPVSHRN